MGILFRCVLCGNAIRSLDNQLHCESCEKEYLFNEGVYLFSQSNHYYSDLDKERMEALIKSSRNDGWKKTVKRKFANNPFLFKIITDETRADWQYMLPLNSESVALDIGAGWGTISIPLARNIKHVVALDGTVDRLQFLSLRASQEKIENISIVHADIFQHPFQMEQFDLISFNGVLEWVGVGNEDINPAEKQLEALKIAYSLLKPGGYLYIGIENALGLKYLLGEPDDHTGVKYISYLDRDTASELNQQYNNMNYSTYTYSKNGYQDLLESAGYLDVQYYYPHPDYKRIESLHSLDDRNVSCFVTESLRYTHSNHSIHERVNDLEKALIEYGELDPFPASYSIIARKEVG